MPGNYDFNLLADNAGWEERLTMLWGGHTTMLLSFWFIWNLPFAYRVETQFWGEVVFLFFKICFFFYCYFETIFLCFCSCSLWWILLGVWLPRMLNISDTRILKWQPVEMVWSDQWSVVSRFEGWEWPAVQGYTLKTWSLKYFWSLHSLVNDGRA